MPEKKTYMEHLRNNKIVKSCENGHFWTFSKAPSMGNDPRYKPILRVTFWKGVEKKNENPDQITISS